MTDVKYANTRRRASAGRAGTDPPCRAENGWQLHPQPCYR